MEPSTTSAELGKLTIQEREVRVKERDLAIRRAELRLKVKEQRLSKWRNPLVVAILAATVTAIANLVVTFVSKSNEVSLAREKFAQEMQMREVEARLEREKYEQQKKDTYDNLLSDAVSKLSGNLSEGYQRGAWLLWALRYDPTSVSSDTRSEYDAAMKEILPKAISTHLAIANQDRKLYEKLTPLVRELGELDGRITKAMLQHKKNYMRGRADFDSLHIELEEKSSLVGGKIAAYYLKIPETETAAQFRPFTPRKDRLAPSGRFARPAQASR